MAIDPHDYTTATLPTPGAGPQMRMVQVACIVASRTNPRKVFKSEPLQELADSIKAAGVHQPILLRPLPASRVEETAIKTSVYAWPFATTRKREPIEYELVAGERRWRACQIASRDEIPAMICDLTDEQVLEIQVVENLQREDVTPLEEAEGYEVLMRTGNLNADQVGAKIGKSRSYVYGRLKVLDLSQQGREALREGLIDFSKALLIARIPDEKLQAEALTYCTRTNWLGDTPSYRDCAAHIQKTYMLKLSAAKFKTSDATLLPKAGSCKECPKRTGANPDLFQDVSADVCTDPKCYQAKEEAHAIAIKRTALERGQEIIEGREAKALMPSAWSGEVKGYLRLDDKSDSPTDKPLRKLIGKAMEQQGVQATLVANPHKDGELVAVLTPAQVEMLLKATNNQQAAEAIERDTQQLARNAKAQAEADAKNQYEEQWRWSVLEATWKAISSPEMSGAVPTENVVRLMARNLAKTHSQERAKKLCKLLDLGKVAPVQGLLEYIEETEAPSDVLQLLICFADVEYRYWLGPDRANADLLQIAADYSVDVEAVKAQTKANQRAAAKLKEQREAAKPAAPKTTSTPPPAAQASPTREKAKGKKSPAAPAGDEAPKTSKAHAAAQIAEALAALEDHGQAPAAQGDEAPAVPGGQPAASALPQAGDGAAAQAHDVAPTAQSDEPPPVADAQAAAAPGGENGADVGNGAAAEAGKLSAGQVVRVKPTATAPKKAPYIGMEGELRYLVGQSRTNWRVAFPQVVKRGMAAVETFNAAELEVVDA
jgi:ParB/RepB/Spo0J family partition protein